MEDCCRSWPTQRPAMRSALTPPIAAGDLPPLPISASQPKKNMREPSMFKLGFLGKSELLEQAQRALVVRCRKRYDRKEVRLIKTQM